VKLVEPQELDALERLGQGIESQQGSPYRLADLAVDGNDLLALGYREGPELGAALARLLDGVLDDPGANDRETLLERAEESAR
jgi:tRNA nucleotidyltransferase (CCA-adding enzyme)